MIGQAIDIIVQPRPILGRGRYSITHQAATDLLQQPIRHNWQHHTLDNIACQSEWWYNGNRIYCLKGVIVNVVFIHHVRTVCIRSRW